LLNSCTVCVIVFHLFSVLTNRHRPFADFLRYSNITSHVLSAIGHLYFITALLQLSLFTSCDLRLIQRRTEVS